MKTGTRKKYDEAFKRDCVMLLEKSGKDLKAFAVEMGVSHWNLRDWKRLYSTPPEPRSNEEMEAELLRLRRENEGLKTQRDILKKALGILIEPRSNATR